MIWDIVRVFFSGIRLLAFVVAANFFVAHVVVSIIGVDVGSAGPLVSSLLGVAAFMMNESVVEAL